jgi:hypothetical protein
MKRSSQDPREKIRKLEEENEELRKMALWISKGATVELEAGLTIVGPKAAGFVDNERLDQLMAGRTSR